MDIYSYFYDTTKNNTNWNSAFILDYAQTNRASGSVYNADSLGWVSLEWDLFEPNKVSRSSKSAQMGQKGYVWLRARSGTEGVNYSSEALIEKCKANTKVNEKKDGSLSKGSWDVSCKVQNEIDISTTRAERFQTLLGKKVIGNNGTVKIKGQCKSEDCRSTPPL